MGDNKTRCCGSCALCIYTYLGDECALTRETVEAGQAACDDYIPEDEQ